MFTPDKPARPRVPTPRALLFSLLPVLFWLLLFSSGVSLIPEHAKPPINVTLLPTLDAALFHRSHTWFETNGTRPMLDVLAAVPYTIHPILPVFYLAAAVASPLTRAAIPRFVLVFGTMNLAAVCTHLVFPTAPPWYFIKHGFQEANYSMKGDPAVLGRVDQRYNITMFHKMYAEGGKVVFGAWPSLHAAWPYLMTRFRPGFGGRVIPFMWGYVFLVWWAAIYLRHHFAMDILGGVLYAEGVTRPGSRVPALAVFVGVGIAALPLESGGFRRPVSLVYLFGALALYLFAVAFVST